MYLLLSRHWIHLMQSLSGRSLVDMFKVILTWLILVSGKGAPISFISNDIYIYILYTIIWWIMCIFHTTKIEFHIIQIHSKGLQECCFRYEWLYSYINIFMHLLSFLTLILCYHVSTSLARINRSLSATIANGPIPRILWVNVHRVFNKDSEKDNMFDQHITKAIKNIKIHGTMMVMWRLGHYHQSNAKMLFPNCPLRKH